jgi:cobalt-zinc-cadmium efflux system membrane fusion protein
MEKQIKTFARIAGAFLLVVGTLWNFGQAGKGKAKATTTNSLVQSSAQKKGHGLVIRLPANRAMLDSVTLATVEASCMRNSMQFSSTVESRNPGTATVTCLLHGAVSKVLVDIGDTVKAGQVMAYINCPDISDAQSALVERQAHSLEATANYELTQTRLKISEKEVERLKSLCAEGIAAKKDVESAESRTAAVQAELQTARAMLSSAQIQLESAKSRLRSFGLEPDHMSLDKVSTELPLRSPIAGLVSQRTAQPGLPVGPLTGAANPALFTIMDLSRVWVMLEVPQDEVSQVVVGARLTFTTEVAPGKKFTGSVTTLGETFDAASRTASVRTEVENPNFILKPGMLVLANVSIGNSLKKRLMIPATAIQKLSNKTFVFKETAPMTFTAIPVTIGERDARSAEVLSGLTLGDRIATNGSFLLKAEAMKNEIGAEE